MSDSHISQLQVSQLPGERGLQVIGAVDLSTREIWRDALESATADGSPTRLDLSELSFIDTRGTSMLLAAAQRQPGTAPLAIIRPPTVLRRVLAVLCPDEPAQIVIEEQEAS
ncbi:STAS domain-containing protein [Amycolatopsis sp. NPDC051128]|uniref:STAS domain-containing protein n=1 Tax=Amycolatopsis sp. NPDC051128 TaxID=3155412 RepID=UPI00342F59DA